MAGAEVSSSVFREDVLYSIELRSGRIDFFSRLSRSNKLGVNEAGLALAERIVDSFRGVAEELVQAGVSKLELFFSRDSEGGAFEAKCIAGQQKKYDEQRILSLFFRVADHLGSKLETGDGTYEFEVNRDRSVEGTCVVLNAFTF